MKNALTWIHKLFCKGLTKQSIELFIDSPLLKQRARAHIRSSIQTWGRGVVFALSIGGVFGAMAEDKAPRLNADYDVSKVSDHVYVIHGPLGFPNPHNQGFMSNPAFIVTSEGVVVVDAGSSVQVGDMVLQKIEQVTDQPVIALFSTHIHGDHWLANQAIHERYDGVPSYAHPDLIKLAKSGEALNWVNLMKQLTDNATAGTRAIIPDTPIVDGDVIEIGGMSFAIHHKGQAHTTTDIAIHLMPDNVLFTGDLVFNRRLGRIDDGRFSGLLETLDHLIELEPAIVVPGHGITGDVGLVKTSRRLHSLIYDGVAELFEEGMPDFEMKSVIADRMEEFSDWDDFEASFGRFISLAYLEVEEENF